MITPEMPIPFCCPSCSGEPLRIDAHDFHGTSIENGMMTCGTCRNDYKIRAGVPDLVPREVLTSEDWKLWNDHLAGFAARREQRLKNPESFSTRVTNRSKALQGAFARFTGIESGPVLDIGCGPGNFRMCLPEGVVYFGIDPLPCKEVSAFPFARAIAEHLPFPADSIRHIVVMSAMDHFRDVEGFCREAVRVLEPEGRLHIVQSVHEVRGVLTSVKVASHWLKDAFESRATRSESKDAPKHMTEFDRGSVYEMLEKYFEVQAEETFSKRWYSPENLFLTMAPRAG